MIGRWDNVDCLSHGEGHITGHDLRHEATRAVDVALLGYGCVGSAVDRLLTEHHDAIEAATGVSVRVRRALVRDLQKARSFPPRPGLLTTDFSQIRDDPSLNVVAEVMGGLVPTGRYMRELLSVGKKLVTTNKQLLAQHGPRLAELAHAARQPIRFEGAVCGAIPIVRTLCEALPPAAVARVVGSRHVFPPAIRSGVVNTGTELREH